MATKLRMGRWINSLYMLNGISFQHFQNGKGTLNIFEKKFRSGRCPHLALVAGP